MKSLYITAFLALSLNIYAQENKIASETPEQSIEYYKESKEFEAKMMKQAKDNEAKKPSTTLVSEEGLAVKQQPSKAEAGKSNSGKHISADASLEEILASIPGRKARRQEVKNAPAAPQSGLIMTSEMTVYDILKTVPKN